MKWTLKRIEEGPPLPLFRAEFQHYAHPEHGDELKAIVLHASDTVNVLTRTVDKEIVLVGQFRFGIADVLYELPAGLMDPGEEPLEAAKRELVEETGYTSENWRYLGYALINPAYVNNGCHHFFADDAQKIGSPRLDHFEMIDVQLIAEDELFARIRNGEVKDAISLSAITRVYPDVFGALL